MDETLQETLHETVHDAVLGSGVGDGVLWCDVVSGVGGVERRGVGCGVLKWGRSGVGYVWCFRGVWFWCVGLWWGVVGLFMW